MAERSSYRRAVGITKRFFVLEDVGAAGKMPRSRHTGAGPRITTSSATPAAPNNWKSSGVLTMNLKSRVGWILACLIVCVLAPTAAHADTLAALVQRKAGVRG